MCTYVINYKHTNTNSSVAGTEKLGESMEQKQLDNHFRALFHELPKIQFPRRKTWAWGICPSLGWLSMSTLFVGPPKGNILRICRKEGWLELDIWPVIYRYPSINLFSTKSFIVYFLCNFKDWLTRFCHCKPILYMPTMYQVIPNINWGLKIKSN